MVVNRGAPYFRCILPPLPYTHGLLTHGPVEQGLQALHLHLQLSQTIVDNLVVQDGRTEYLPLPRVVDRLLDERSQWLDD